MPGPLDLLEALARQEVVVTPTYRHLEVFTMRGLLTVLWHGDARRRVGGRAGRRRDGRAAGAGRRLLPLARRGAGGRRERVGVLRVGWRRPNDIDLCTLDLLAAADLAARAGAERFVTGGHSFGGAIAVRAGMAMGDWTRGVVTFATQSAGCEEAHGLTAPLLAFHGDRDEILPARGEPGRGSARRRARRGRDLRRGGAPPLRGGGAVASRGAALDPGAPRYGLT